MHKVLTQNTTISRVFTKLQPIESIPQVFLPKAVFSKLLRIKSILEKQSKIGYKCLSLSSLSSFLLTSPSEPLYYLISLTRYIFSLYFKTRGVSFPVPFLRTREPIPTSCKTVVKTMGIFHCALEMYKNRLPSGFRVPGFLGFLRSQNPGTRNPLYNLLLYISKTQWNILIAFYDTFT